MKSAAALMISTTSFTSSFLVCRIYIQFPLFYSFFIYII
ncbi:hypothetical protein CU013_1585 [Enterococcus faecium]|nr:hypothetical protein [Enterococcus faecium]MBK4835248.1 hypothetical protein [Enterococcus faecium]